MNATEALLCKLNTSNMFTLSLLNYQSRGRGE